MSGFAAGVDQMRPSREARGEAWSEVPILGAGLYAGAHGAAAKDLAIIVIGPKSLAAAAGPGGMAWARREAGSSEWRGP